jgi:hypothetical protein
MKAIAKVLVPNKVWILEERGSKLGTLNKEKKGYAFFKNGVKVELDNLTAVKEKFGVEIFKENLTKKTVSTEMQSIYDYPCKSKPYGPVYNIRKKLPIYAKSAKSKSLYCAGYYLIKFKKGWAKAFCPKLITLERYPFQGPFKTEEIMKNILNLINKNETT